MVREIALQHARTYFDCMTPSQSSPWMASQGFMSDQTHESLSGNQYLANFVWNDLFFDIRTPRILILQNRNGSFVLQYGTFSGTIYTVDPSADFINWNAVSSSIGGDSAVVTNFNQGSPRFSRLRLQPGIT